ncbi:hypothetical protein [Paenibacillus sp. 481]|uniref:hypothetical protein n=1 Tax=Paenibacillus sp. 481 TaxID=2835869 RepID=UPI001E2B3010|nr:hypothetical protein [Paenibacillus sp. 481]UHA72046.1 hypothetical protein KIK04_15170 [Paenibacillus sp. 481]
MPEDFLVQQTDSVLATIVRLFALEDSAKFEKSDIVNDWLSENASLIGFISFLLTLFLTGLNVYFAMKSQKYSSDSVKLNSEIRKENNTPNVIVYFDMELMNNLDFKVENIGAIAAKNIKITLIPINEVVNTEHFEKLYVFRHPIAFLAPKQIIKCSVESLFALTNSNNEYPTYNVSIDFSDLEDNQYKREYLIDANMYQGSYQITIKTTHHLTKVVEKIERHLNNLVQVINKERDK